MLPPSNDHSPTRVLLIDLDNNEKKFRQLPDHVDQYQRIVAVHGSREPKVPLSLVALFGEFMASGRLEVHAMKRGGANAADFGLLFHAGRLMREMPEGTHFEIWSNDGDLDHAVDLLNAYDCPTVRLSNLGGPPVQKKPPMPAAEPLPLLPQTYEQELALRIFERIQIDPCRPRKKKGLANTIKSMLRTDGYRAPNPQDMIRFFHDLALIAEENGQIIYRDRATGEEDLCDEAIDPDDDDFDDSDIPF